LTLTSTATPNATVYYSGGGHGHSNEETAHYPATEQARIGHVPPGLFKTRRRLVLWRRLTSAVIVVESWQYPSEAAATALIPFNQILEA
jgi:hypothetical protein